MSGLRLIADTNILIYLISGNKSVRNIIHESHLSVSFITEMELLSWPSAKDSELHVIELMLKQCKIISFNDDIKRLAIQIRKKHKIKLPDAIVAATSMHLSLPLVSADRVFTRIKDLELLFLDISE